MQIHTRYREPGGEDVAVHAERRLLTDAGHEVKTLEFENAAGTLRALRQLAASPWNARSAHRATEAVQGFRPDVVHVHNTWFAASPAVLYGARRSRTAVLMTLHNFRLGCVNGLLFRDGVVCEDCVGSHPWHGVLHRCYRGSAGASAVAATQIALHRRLGSWSALVDMFIALSRFSIPRHVANGVPGERIVLKRNHVDDPGPRELPPSAARDVLFVGRLSAEKGLERLVDAWGQAAPEGLRLVLVGDGPMRARLAENTTPNVEVRGLATADEVMRRMLHARALVVPSEWYEGQPMVVLEALSAGLPVMGSDIGGLAEVLAEAPHCWRIPPSDTGAWTRALAELRDDRVDVAGREARDLYERKYATRVALDDLLGAYRTAIEWRGAGGAASPTAHPRA